MHKAIGIAPRQNFHSSSGSLTACHSSGAAGTCTGSATSCVAMVNSGCPTACAARPCLLIASALAESAPQRGQVGPVSRGAEHQGQVVVTRGSGCVGWRDGMADCMRGCFRRATFPVAGPVENVDSVRLTCRDINLAESSRHFRLQFPRKHVVPLLFAVTFRAVSTPVNPSQSAI